MIRKVNGNLNKSFVAFSGESKPVQNPDAPTTPPPNAPNKTTQTPPTPATPLKIKKKKYDKDTLLKNNLATNARISFDKMTNAATIYTAKGLTGSKNANFYEFLTLGTIPYIVGSLTLMSVFNSASKHFNSFDKAEAKKVGNKMALGVLFYALAKELAKPLISKPVQLATGVDTELPYAKVIYELPDSKDDSDITSIEYHKVFESVEFPRWDLLYADEAKGKKRNEYYDKVAQKLGLGENLKDSDQEVKPRIKEITTKSIAVNNIVPYLWATAGVALAMQKPWDNFFPNFSLKFWKFQEFKKALSSFSTAFKESSKELYKGGANTSKYAKHIGKAVVFTPIAATVLGIIDIISSSKKVHQSDSSKIIDKNRKYVSS